MKNLLFIVILIFSTLANSKQEIIKVTTESKLIESFVKATPINRRIPRSNRYKSGDITFSFVVNKEGNIQNIEVLQSNIADKSINPIIRQMKNWKYEPATLNGEPIDSCSNWVVLDVSTHEDKYRKIVQKHIDRLIYSVANKEHEKADNYAKFLINYKKNLKYYAEHVWYNYALSTYYQIKGDTALQIYYLEQINLEKVAKSRTVIESKEMPTLSSFNNTSDRGYGYNGFDQKLLSLTIIKDMLETQFNHYYETQQFKEAISIYEVDLDLPFDVHLKIRKGITQRYLTAVKMVEAGVPINCSEYIDQKGFAYHSLSQNNFYIDLQSGAIDKIELRCDTQHQAYSFNNQTPYTIPEAWGDCSVVFRGEEGTKFTVTEF